jgi:hypothetical protein
VTQYSLLKNFQRLGPVSMLGLREKLSLDRTALREFLRRLENIEHCPLNDAQIQQ